LFTGIIEEVGQVQAVDWVEEEALSLTVQAKKVLEEVRLGESIAVNGICLTVASYSEDTFTVDVMPETMKATSLREVGVGSLVNLEKALRLEDRMGGHLVTGQVDGVGKILRKEKQANAMYVDIEVPEEFMIYFVEKGSVAIDGISLTVFAVRENLITLSLIPHTLQETNLRSKEVGDLVNIECDTLAKQVHHQLRHYLPQE